MEQRAPSTPKPAERSNRCRCGGSMPKTSYMCSRCWSELSAPEQAELRHIRRAIRDRRLEPQARA